MKYSKYLRNSSQRETDEHAHTYGVETGENFIFDPTTGHEPFLACFRKVCRSIRVRTQSKFRIPRRVRGKNDPKKHILLRSDDFQALDARMR